MKIQLLLYGERHIKKFKDKKGQDVPIEALLKKRLILEILVSSINKLVDIYNSASLKYALPCGAEDLDSFVGGLKTYNNSGGDKFIPLGSEEEDNTLPNELCYIDTMKVLFVVVLTGVMCQNHD